MGSTEASRPRHRAEPSVELGPFSLDEVHRRFSGHWVLLRVTEVDASQSPAGGHVVTFGSSRKVCKALTRLLPDRTPDTHYYLFSAGPRVTSLATMRAAIRGEIDGIPTLQ